MLQPIYVSGHAGALLRTVLTYVSFPFCHVNSSSNVLRRVSQLGSGKMTYTPFGAYQTPCSLFADFSMSLPLITVKVTLH
jgi:hypothetical protein